MLKQTLRRMGVFAVVTGMGVTGCSDPRGGVSAVGPEGGPSGPLRLDKVAVQQEVSQGRVVIVATVTRNAAPVAGVQVGFSRAISGRVPDYRWTGLTDANGRAEVGIAEEVQDFRRIGVNGLYRVRATNPATGEVVGMWSSVPINGGQKIELDLPVGRLCSILSVSSLTEPEAFIAQMRDFVGYMNWQAVDYTIGSANPASGTAHNSALNAYARRVFKNAAAALTGGEYAKGSIIVKETFTWENGQKRYAEAGGVFAMVKRGGGFNPQGGGWEWFALAPGSSEVLGRGGAEMMDGMCNGCHAAARSQAGGADMVFPHPAEYVASERDFAGYQDWTRIDERTGTHPLLGPTAHRPQAVRRVYKKQPLANPDTRDQGYPTGTILLKAVTDNAQAVEITAMVKRGGRFNERGGGWEWFMLEPATGAVAGRGANLMDGMCSSCHSAALSPANGRDYVFKHSGDPFNR